MKLKIFIVSRFSSFPRGSRHEKLEYAWNSRTGWKKHSRHRVQTRFRVQARFIQWVILKVGRTSDCRECDWLQTAPSFVEIYETFRLPSFSISRHSRLRSTGDCDIFDMYAGLSIPNFHRKMKHIPFFVMFLRFSSFIFFFFSLYFSRSTFSGRLKGRKHGRCFRRKGLRKYSSILIFSVFSSILIF